MSCASTAASNMPPLRPSYTAAHHYSLSKAHRWVLAAVARPRDGPSSRLPASNDVFSYVLSDVVNCYLH